MHACVWSNLLVTKYIVELMFSEKMAFNCTDSFAEAASSGAMDICRYLLDRKAHVRLFDVTYKVEKLGSIDSEIFQMIYEIADSSIQNQLLRCIPYAISNKNKKGSRFGGY